MHDLVFQEFSEIGPFETLEWLYSQMKDDVTYCRRDWQVMTKAKLWRSGVGCADLVKYRTRFLFFSKDADSDENEPFLVRPEQMLHELGEAIRDCGLIRRFLPERTSFEYGATNPGHVLANP